MLAVTSRRNDGAETRRTRPRASRACSIAMRPVPQRPKSSRVAGVPTLASAAGAPASSARLAARSRGALHARARVRFRFGIRRSRVSVSSSAPRAARSRPAPLVSAPARCMQLPIELTSGCNPRGRRSVRVMDGLTGCVGLSAAAALSNSARDSSSSDSAAAACGAAPSTSR
jgi:hypothetical protein